MTNLEGDWQVQRLGGLLPPMTGIWKRIRGASGQTRMGPFWPGAPFPLSSGAPLAPRWFTAPALGTRRRVAG